jgi:hypothetical protein
MSDREALLREALKECSDELAEWVQEHYRGHDPSAPPHPADKRRYDRDMEPVVRARALLAAAPEFPQTPLDAGAS